MKDLLKMNDSELWKALTWDRIYGPQIQAINRKKRPINAGILQSAREELRMLRQQGQAISKKFLS